MYDVTSCLAAWSHVPSGQGLTPWTEIPYLAAIEVGGLHPIRMHSCFLCQCHCIVNTFTWWCGTHFFLYR